MHKESKRALNNFSTIPFPVSVEIDVYEESSAPALTFDGVPGETATYHRHPGPRRKVPWSQDEGFP